MKILETDQCENCTYEELLGGFKVKIEECDQCNPLAVGKEINIIFLDDKGSMFGSADYTRWNNAKWYEKLLGKILPKYKESFVDIKPLKATYKGNGTHEIIYK